MTVARAVTVHRPQSCWSFGSRRCAFFSSFSFSFFLSFAFAFAFFGAGAAASAAAAPSTPGWDSLRFGGGSFCQRVVGVFCGEGGDGLRWAEIADLAGAAEMRALRRDAMCWPEDAKIYGRMERDKRAICGAGFETGRRPECLSQQSETQSGLAWRTRRVKPETKKLRMQIGDVSALRCSRVRRAGGCGLEVRAGGGGPSAPEFVARSTCGAGGRGGGA